MTINLRILSFQLCGRMLGIGGGFAEESAHQSAVVVCVRESDGHINEEQPVSHSIRKSFSLSNIKMLVEYNLSHTTFHFPSLLLRPNLSTLSLQLRCQPDIILRNHFSRCRQFAAVNANSYLRSHHFCIESIWSPYFHSVKKNEFLRDEGSFRSITRVTPLLPASTANITLAQETETTKAR
uniref:Myotubularin phosphatase domain-containing protein n=1 Tax=Ascaris lumbricoides TaxID=6252 RepID=A0A0M3IBI3_ASCLU